jgi:competence protein ComEA
MFAVVERYRIPIMGVLCALLLTAGGVVYLRRPMPQPIEIEMPSPSPTESPAELAVYVTGAVANPGVYYLPEESRAQDALEAAGGPAANADLDRVNLAQRLHDGDQIYFPEIGEENPPITGVSGSNDDLININTASAAELETLPGIGPVLAGAIVDHREANGPFSTIEELTNVRGIGQAVFGQIEELVTVR